nr:MAG TPA: hypothetical protein [Caudoviricetes sp.]
MELLIGSNTSMTECGLARIMRMTPNGIQAAKARAGSIPSHPQVSKITESAVFSKTFLGRNRGYGF